jgi:hypothetical protein
MAADDDTPWHSSIAEVPAAAPAMNDEEIRAYVLDRGRAGVSAEAIAAELKARGAEGWSRPTVGRFLREQIGSRRARKSSNHMLAAEPVEPEAELAPPELPAGAALAEIEDLLVVARRQLAAAEAASNGALCASLIARATALLEAKRKATPEPPPDPNTDPDMIRLGEQVRVRLYKRLDDALKKRGT